MSRTRTGEVYFKNLDILPYAWNYGYLSQISPQIAKDVLMHLLLVLVGIKPRTIKLQATTSSITPQSLEEADFNKYGPKMASF